MNLYSPLSACTLLLCVILGTTGAPKVTAQEPVKFDINDVSFLFPVPTSKTEAEKLISMDEKLADGTAIWPKEIFDKILNRATEVSAVPGGDKIVINNNLRDPHVWKVAGIRVNPSALGASDAVLKGMKLPQVPGIRLIVQPVLTDGDDAELVDFAAHVVYNFTKPLLGPDGAPVMANGRPVPAPDDDAFRAIIEGLKTIKKSIDHGITTTTGAKLKVHPGFTADPDGFTQTLRTFLRTQLKRERFDVVSFMGLDPSGFEPWIFFAAGIDPVRNEISPRPVRGNFEGPNPDAIILSFRGGPNIQPAPKPAASAAEKGFGISTAPLFPNAPNLERPLVPGAVIPPAGSPPFIPDLTKLKVRDAADYIANPLLLHTLNCDCVSCHTETTRRLTLKLPASPIAFPQPAGISTVDRSVLHEDKWNVRNFGWGLNFFQGREFHPTVSQRAANEAAESADFINRHYLQPPPP